jgi:hypothetical protein
MSEALQDSRTDQTYGVQFRRVNDEGRTYLLPSDV